MKSLKWYADLFEFDGALFSRGFSRSSQNCLSLTGLNYLADRADFADFYNYTEESQRQHRGPQRFEFFSVTLCVTPCPSV
jgi:hypothetical protein